MLFVGLGNLVGGAVLVGAPYASGVGARGHGAAHGRPTRAGDEAMADDERGTLVAAGARRDTGL